MAEMFITVIICYKRNIGNKQKSFRAIVKRKQRQNS